MHVFLSRRQAETRQTNISEVSNKGDKSDKSTIQFRCSKSKLQTSGACKRRTQQRSKATKDAHGEQHMGCRPQLLCHVEPSDQRCQYHKHHAKASVWKTDVESEATRSAESQRQNSRNTEERHTQEGPLPRASLWAEVLDVPAHELPSRCQLLCRLALTALTECRQDRLLHKLLHRQIAALTDCSTNRLRHRQTAAPTECTGCYTDCCMDRPLHRLLQGLRQRLLTNILVMSGIFH